MISNLKKKLIVRKYYQTELVTLVKKIKKHTVRIIYLKSKNGQHRKNCNLSKLYITLKKKWYFQKKNNIKLLTKWQNFLNENQINIKPSRSILSKVNYDDIKWFY